MGKVLGWWTTLAETGSNRCTGWGVDFEYQYSHQKETPWLVKAVNAMVINALTQGIAVATGLQDKFQLAWCGRCGRGQRWVMCLSVELKYDPKCQRRLLAAKCSR